MLFAFESSLSAVIRRIPRIRLITRLKDSPFLFSAASFSYASMSIVMVFTAILDLHAPTVHLARLSLLRLDLEPHLFSQLLHPSVEGHDLQGTFHVWFEMQSSGHVDCIQRPTIGQRGSQAY